MKNSLPNHVLVIPDGNRRWAKKNKLVPWLGHEEGAKRIEEITRKALKLGIKNLTFWGSSKDNLTKRSLRERRALFEVYRDYFTKLLKNKDIYDYQARIQLVGDWNKQFPTSLKKILRKGVLKTKKHSCYFLNFLLAYNGDEDMFTAIKRIIKQVKEGKKITVNHRLVEDNLMSAVLPKVDLIIRTGVQKDPHNSAGVLMWQTQNAQYFFSSQMMPEFSADNFEEAIKDFSQRERRIGK